MHKRQTNYDEKKNYCKIIQFPNEHWLIADSRAKNYRAAKQSSCEWIYINKIGSMHHQFVVRWRPFDTYYLLCNAHNDFLILFLLTSLISEHCSGLFVCQSNGRRLALPGCWRWHETIFKWTQMVSNSDTKTWNGIDRFGWTSKRGGTVKRQWVCA